MEYSYSFCEELQQKWEWSERYSGQPQILGYLNHVADRFELRRDISFDTRVEAATFDDSAGRWRGRTQNGAELSAQFLIMATGCLSTPNTPHIDGIETFTGPIYHTGRWPHVGPLWLSGITINAPFSTVISSSAMPTSRILSFVCG